MVRTEKSQCLEELPTRKHQGAQESKGPVQWIKYSRFPDDKNADVSTHQSSQGHISSWINIYCCICGKKSQERKAWVFACIFLCLDNLTNGIVLEGQLTACDSSDT